MTVVTQTDRPKSVSNRCVIKVFGGVLCCPLVFKFCWYRGFEKRNESDFLLLLLHLPIQDLCIVSYIFVTSVEQKYKKYYSVKGAKLFRSAV